MPGDTPDSDHPSTAIMTVTGVATDFVGHSVTRARYESALPVCATYFVTVPEPVRLAP